MTWRIDNIELVSIAIIRQILQGYTLGLDGDSSFSLNIHRVKDLVCHFTIGQSTTHLDKPISQRRLTMINMGDNGKISNEFWLNQGIFQRTEQRASLIDYENISYPNAYLSHVMALIAKV